MQHIGEIKEAVFACVDGSQFSEAVSDYGVHIAKQLQLPLVLFNTVEHPYSSSKTDLSGNLSLGESEDLLGALSEEDKARNKEARAKGKALLTALKEKVESSGFHDVYAVQRHGILHENLKELEEKLRVVLFGVSGMGHPGEESGIGSQVETIIREVDAPVLLVNKAYTPPERVMIAFNGTSGSVHALEEVSALPMLSKEVKRYIVSVHKESAKAEELIAQAKALIKDPSLNCEYIAKEGDPFEGILGCIEEKGVDMLAIGSYSHGKLKTALFGSFTTKLIKSVKVPLIVLK
ncbi:MAG: universal stress protein [Campylobacterales bacterium]|nr:universal stress protein [Campylobacterales bacterium]